MEHKNDILLKRLDKTISQDTDISDQDFAILIYDLISGGYVDEEAFRETFALSQDAVHRWSAGNNLPQPDIRPVILKWVVDYIQK